MALPGCDPGPLAGTDPASQSELPILKILVVDCKQGAVRAVRSDKEEQSNMMTLNVSSDSV